MYILRRSAAADEAHEAAAPSAPGELRAWRHASGILNMKAWILVIEGCCIHLQCCMLVVYTGAWIEEIAHQKPTPQKSTWIFRGIFEWTSAGIFQRNFTFEISGVEYVAPSTRT